MMKINQFCKILALVLMSLFLLSHPVLAKKLKIVAATEDLASIARLIGGEEVEVFSIARGYQDPHFVDAKPSFIVKLQKADMFIQAGLGLEIGWAPQLLDGSRNGKIMPGGRGYLDASRGVPLLEAPRGDPAALRAQGDIHASGNHHYWLDPRRGKIIAKNIYRALASIRPEKQALFLENLNRFSQKLSQKIEEWQAAFAAFKGAKIIAFHNTWPYFEEFSGIDIIGFIEPKPGIPPTPKHLVKVIQTVQREGVKAIIISPYYSQKSARLVARRTGVPVVELAASVGAYPEIKDYFDLFDYNLRQLSNVLN